MGCLLQDLRYGVRTLVCNSRLTAAILLTMALGIGANCAVFSVVNAVLLRPLPFADPDRLVALWNKWPSQYGQERLPISAPDFRDWESQNRVFEEMALYGFNDFNVRLGSVTERLTGFQVTENFLRVLGVAPTLGRSFLPDECAPGGDRAAILSYPTWQGRFAGRLDILGQHLIIDGTPHTVVGVMPSDFRMSLQFFLKGFNTEPALWVSHHFDDLQRGNHNYYALARLKPGVSLAGAQADMSAIARRLQEQYHSMADGVELEVTSLRRSLFGHLRTPLLLVLAVAGFILVIACANIANLLLARRAQRQREMAIRTALGANRIILIRQLLTESCLLSLTGGLLGLGVGFYGCRLFNTVADHVLTGNALPIAGLDWRVLGYTMLASLLAGLLFGLTPAMQTSRFDIRQTLKDGCPNVSPGRGKRSLADILAIGELALSLVLLIAAGLLIKSFWGIWSIHPGFRPENVLTLQLSVSGNDYDSATRRLNVLRQTQDRLLRLPGVQAVGWTDFRPSNGARSWAFYMEGRPKPALDEAPSANVIGADLSYLEALGIPLKHGRFFQDRDNDLQSPPVVVINERLARQQWGNLDPVGKRIYLFGNECWATVVGVIGDIRQNGLAQQVAPQIHLPYQALPVPSGYLLIRTRQEPMSLAASVRKEIQALDPNLPVTELQTMKEGLSRSVAEKQYLMELMGAFAIIALSLAVIGVYGVLSYSASQRAAEIGIRMALGARPWDILAMVLGHGLRLILFGTGLGLLGALAAMDLLSSQLVGVTPTDPVIFGLVVLFLDGAALLACCRPALGAARLDPLAAVRCQ